MRNPPDVETERRISLRFRELRELTCQSQSRLAGILGVTRDHIANIESGRTPLRYQEARRALNAQEYQGMSCPFNPLWLAGEVDWPVQMDWPLLLPETERLELPPALRFSEFVAMHHSLLVALTNDPPDPELPATWLQPYLFHWLKLHQKETDLGKSVVFVENVFAWSAQRAAHTSALAADLLKKYNQAKSAMRESNYLEPSEIGGKRSKLIVDMLRGPARMPGVTSETGYWKALVKRVCTLTSALGQKAQLARELNTTRQAVNKWLSGSGAPSAEITLRLLNWVNQQEQKPNTLGGAINTIKGKTQPKASNEKKPRSNPSKR